MEGEEILLQGVGRGRQKEAAAAESVGGSGGSRLCDHAMRGKKNVGKNGYKGRVKGNAYLSGKKAAADGGGSSEALSGGLWSCNPVMHNIKKRKVTTKSGNAEGGEACLSAQVGRGMGRRRGGSGDLFTVGGICPRHPLPRR